MPPPTNDEDRALTGSAAFKVESAGGGFDTFNVRQGFDNVTPTRRYPVAYASLYAPAGRRRCWWAAYICAHCGGGHFARLRRAADASSVRRSGCGRLIRLVVARTYRGRKAAA